MTRQNEADKEERVQTHAASLGKGHLSVQSHQQSADDCNQNGCNINCVPDLTQGAVGREAGDLVGVGNDNICHCEECCQASNDLCLDIRTAFGNLKKLIHLRSSPVFFVD